MGSQDQPLATVGAALGMAVENRRSSIGTLVWIHPGVYREGIDQFFAEDGDAPIVLEATVRGQAVISGSDVWDGWVYNSAMNTYTHPWRYDWGVAPNPWEGDVSLAPIVRRREMIFANGSFLEQKLALADVQVTPGSFFVNEQLDTVYLHLPQGTEIANTIIEVAVRPVLFRAQGLHHLSVIGLVFQHANSALPRSAADFVDQNDILVEDCTAQWNNWTGFAFKVDGLTVRRTSGIHNGAHGMAGYKTYNALFEDIQILYNNWRADLGGFKGWDVGNKFLRLRDVTFRRLVSFGNGARGLWLDSDNVNVTLEEVELCNNGRDGIFVEANQGPILILNSTFCNNAQAGILTSTTHNLTLQGNVFSGNARAQIAISGDLDRPVTDHLTGEISILNNKNWTWIGNTFVGQASDQLLVSTTLPQAYWNILFMPGSFIADQNRYYNPTDNQAFQLPGGHRVTFGGWQAATGQDGQSTFGPPK